MKLLWVYRVILKVGTHKISYHAVAGPGQPEKAIDKIRAFRKAQGFTDEPLVRCEAIAILDAM